MLCNFLQLWASLMLTTFVVSKFSFSAGQDDFLGCGGFVKVSTALAKVLKQKPDYLDVKIKLITKDGIVKSETESAPNGYYYLPIYDKGAFELQIEGPEGWSFSPKSIQVQVGENAAGNTDGSTGDESTAASKNVVFGCEDDVDFFFTGFAVKGHVAGPSVQGVSQVGPAGVEVTLSPGEGADAAQGAPVTVTSEEGGLFSFQNVFPGKYLVKGSHPDWTVQTEDIGVEVSWGNANLDQPLLISGYDVRGAVVSGAADPVSGVNFFLYSTDGHHAQPPAGCPPLPARLPTRDDTPLCHAASDERGNFVLKNIPCGHFELVPFYENEHTTFNVVPFVEDVVVGHGSFVVQDQFRVSGFSLGGRVVDQRGRGVAGATVLVDGTPRAWADASGAYHLQGLEPGKYDLSAQADDMEFSHHPNLDIKPNIKTLPDITLTKLSVSGTVHTAPDLSVSNFVQVLPRKIQVVEEASGEVVAQATTDQSGRYSLLLAPGTYKVSAQVKAIEQAAGLLLAPLEHAVAVPPSEAVTGLDFSPVVTTVSGKVKCLEEGCGPSVIVSLAPVGRTHPPRQTLRVASDGAFTFHQVPPGRYAVHVSHEKDTFCWGHERFPEEEISGSPPPSGTSGRSVEVQVVHDPVEGVEFEHTGFILTAVATHTVQLEGTVCTQAGTCQDIEPHVMQAGTNLVCLSHPGAYTLRPRSCYRFDKEEYEFHTSSPSVLKLQASRTRVPFVVQAKDVEGQPEIFVDIASDFTGTTTIQADLGPDRTYTLEVWVAEDEEVVLQPRVKPGVPLLFYPPSQTITAPPPAAAAAVAAQGGRVGDACPSAGEPFVARPGLVLQGTVTPELAGVTISVFADGGHEPAIQVTTDASGVYAAGPLHDDRSYRLTASKKGYHFQQTQDQDEAGRQLNFVHKKLGQVDVRVVDDQGEPLDGVLLSLSGEQYRNNNKTKPDGSLSFPALFPGSYFLRPLLKEYVFEPSSQSLDVIEGATLDVVFNANRVAYSCFGSVSTLNRRPLAKVAVEAVSTSGNQMEDTVTDASGQFRLRGLQPNSSYIVRMKGLDDPETAQEQATPAQVTVHVQQANLEGVNFILFPPGNDHSVMGVVNADPEHLDTIYVTLTGGPSGLRRVHRNLGFGNTFEFSNLAAGAYTVSLGSTLSQREWQLPEHAAVDLHLQDSTWHHEVKLEYPVTRRVFEEEAQPLALYTLLVTVAVVVMAFKREKVAAFVHNLRQQTGSGGDGPVSAGSEVTAEGRRTRSKSKGRRK